MINTRPKAEGVIDQEEICRHQDGYGHFFEAGGGGRGVEHRSSVWCRVLWWKIVRFWVLTTEMKTGQMRYLWDSKGRCASERDNAILVANEFQDSRHFSEAYKKMM